MICRYDVAEMCIDHMVMGKTEASYFRSDLLDQRAEVMQQWAEFVTGLTMDDRADIREAKALAAFDMAQRDGKDFGLIDWMEVVEDRSEGA